MARIGNSGSAGSPARKLRGPQRRSARSALILGAILCACSLLSCAPQRPISEIPTGYVQLPITGRVVPEARACAIATAFRLSVSTGTGALSGAALANALRPWGAIINATYCTRSQLGGQR